MRLQRSCHEALRTRPKHIGSYRNETNVMLLDLRSKP